MASSEFREVDYHNSMAHVEEPADAWEQYDERGSPENLAA